MVQSNAAAEESSASSEELSSQAQLLYRELDKFQLLESQASRTFGTERMDFNSDY